ncbi:hypothetical protein SDC9_210918 [bioreactor metagenome]|uniref:Uncharacterized protein n=1 Tax=bioreactor metagenome TaxID=1076179 RepID=A0A645JV99_9ZZZZ
MSGQAFKPQLRNAERAAVGFEADRPGDQFGFGEAQAVSGVGEVAFPTDVSGAFRPDRFAVERDGRRLHLSVEDGVKFLLAGPVTQVAALAELDRRGEGHRQAAPVSEFEFRVDRAEHVHVASGEAC